MGRQQLQLAHSCRWILFVVCARGRIALAELGCVVQHLTGYRIPINVLYNLRLGLR